MIAIYSFLRSYWKTIAFFVAVVFFLMDMSGLIGNIGYYLYYPAIFVMATYCLFNNNQVSFIYLLYIGACFLSIILNDIPSYYLIEFRFITFIVLLVAFSPLVNSRSIALLRLRLLYFATIFSVILVFINFIIFQAGGLTDLQMDVYARTGIYFGTTANNEFATLGAISTMYIITFLVSFATKIRIWENVILLLLLFCCISMMLIASSRTAFIGTIISIVFIAIYANKKNWRFLPITFIALLAFFTLAFVLFAGDMRGMIEYKQAGDVSGVNVYSRQSMWEMRLDEFKSSPMCGIGFATISNPTEFARERGVIEAGSGWLSVLSQTGILGGVCMLFMLIPNILFLFRNKNTSYSFIWLVGLCVIFLISPISEAYITTVGAVLCCLFWLTLSVVDSFRIGLLRSVDLEFFLSNRKRQFIKKMIDEIRHPSLHSEH